MATLIFWMAFFSFALLVACCLFLSLCCWKHERITQRLIFTALINGMLLAAMLNLSLNIA